MDLIKELIALSKKPETTVMEGSHVFPDVDKLELDPDRMDAHDVARALLPTMIRMAYVHLLEDKKTHERRHGPKSDDEDAYNFDLSKDALFERFEDLQNALADRIKELDEEDFNVAVKQLSREFTEPLEEKK
jgi:hypothetical protein